MNENLSFNICVVCTIFMIISSAIYLFLHPNSILDFSSPFLWLTFISAVIGVIICIIEIINDVKVRKNEISV